MSGPPQFDPDQYMISKEDLLMILGAIEKRWKKSKVNNLKYILAAKSVKAGIMLSDEQTISTIWADLIRAVNHLIELNASERLKTEFPQASFIRDNLIRKIEAGDLF